MSDTLSKICGLARNRRAKWKVADTASISVEFQGNPNRPPCFVGAVWIDRRQVGCLTNRGPATFPIEPGEHTVLITLRRRFRVATYPSKAVVSRSMTLKPGEEVELVCGVSREVARRWSHHRAMEGRRALLFGLGWFLVVALGYLLGHVLRPGVAWMVIRLPIDGVWIPLCYRLFGSSTTGPLAGSIWLFAMGSKMITHRKKSMDRLHSEYGHPYYLEPKSL
jgi:hypothetical protein